MDVFWNVFESIIILLGIGIIGFTIISRKIVPIKILEVVSPLILDIALPSLIFYNIITRFNPENYESWWSLPLWWILFGIISLIFSLLGAKFIYKKFRSEFTISLLYPNSIFVPMVVIQNLYGENSNVLVELFLFTFFFPAFMFNTYYLFFMNNETGKRKFNWSKFFNPILIATSIAVLIRLSGTFNYVPDVVVYPAIQNGTDELLTCDNISIDDETRHIYNYLLETNQLERILNYDKDKLHIFSRTVFKYIQEGNPEWEKMVPAYVSESIKSKKMFAYKNNKN